MHRVGRSLASMGTRVECVAVGASASGLEAAVEAAFDEIRALEARLSAFVPQSLVCRINRAPAGAWVRVDAEVFELLTLCDRLHRETDGAFDPALGALMRAWGMRDGPADDRPESAPHGWAFVELDPSARGVRRTVDGVEIDLGGVGKGYVLDRAAAVLRESGVERGLIHAGTSSAVAIGAPPGEDGWPVRIPGPAGELVVRLADESLSVSEPSGRSARVGGRDVGHVMDPRTGEPTASSALAAVVCADAACADAWSTALLVLGPGARVPEGMAGVVVPDEGGATMLGERRDVFKWTERCEGLR